jgi:hypothetical protein
MGGLAQVVECLLSKKKALSSNPRTEKEKKQKTKKDTVLGGEQGRRILGLKLLCRAGVRGRNIVATPAQTFT